MCSPVNSTFVKSAPIWAVPCPGSVCSSEYLVRELSTLTPQPVPSVVPAAEFGGRGDGMQAQVGADMARLRHVRQFQDDQGWSVFAGTAPIAPQTAHMDATERGATGPFPWRRLA